jgi:hypothetical protein
VQVIRWMFCFTLPGVSIVWLTFVDTRTTLRNCTVVKWFVVARDCVRWQFLVKAFMHPLVSVTRDLAS